MYRKARLWNRSIRSLGRWLIHIPWTFSRHLSIFRRPPLRQRRFHDSYSGILTCQTGLLLDPGAWSMNSPPFERLPRDRVRCHFIREPGGDARIYIRGHFIRLAVSILIARKWSWRLNHSPNSDNDENVFQRRIRIAPLTPSRLINFLVGLFTYFATYFQRPYLAIAFNYENVFVHLIFLNIFVS